jgi:hypothetical protein
MAHVVMTAHAPLAPALAEVGVLGWLEELGLEVAFGEAWHLLAFDDSSQAGLMASVDFYPLDGGQATQVRMYVSKNEPDKPISDLAKFLQELVETDPHWVLDGLETLPATLEVR